MPNRELMILKSRVFQSLKEIQNQCDIVLRELGSDVQKHEKERIADACRYARNNEFFKADSKFMKEAETFFADLLLAYPSADLMGYLGVMSLWLRTHKPKTDYRRFIKGWIRRSYSPRYKVSKPTKQVEEDTGVELEEL